MAQRPLRDGLMPWKNKNPPSKPRIEPALKAVMTSDAPENPIGRLCEKCRKLDLETYLGPIRRENYVRRRFGFESTWTDKNYVQTHMRDCRLCKLLHSLFEDSQSNWLQIWFSGGMEFDGDPSNYFRFADERFQTKSLLVAIQKRSVARTIPSMTAWNACIGLKLQVDFESRMGIARKWIESCQVKHQSTCSGLATISSAHLRVIDCRRGKLCFIPSHQPYVALSYVWGEHTQTMTSVRRLATSLPQTVKDAILVTQRLGFTYIWVDRYCIDQDNLEEKHTLISSMDKIYQRAEVTICAAAGSDANYGLPGVSRIQQRRTLKLGKHTLALTPSPRLEIERAHWSTRAWTYQEMLLSRRRLVFTESQMYFQCVYSYCELLHRHQLVHPDVYAFPGSLKGKVGNYTFEVFHRIREYSKRTLSYDCDALNGLNGIFNAFKALGGGNHFYGVPTITEVDIRLTMNGAFIVGLTWRGTSIHAEKRIGSWPSWTWATLKNAEIIFDEDALGKEWKAGGATFKVTHRSGVEIDLFSFATHEQDYTHFFPLIAIDGYTYTHQSNTFRHRNSRALTIFFDDDKCTQAPFTTIFLGTYGGLRDDLEHSILFLLVRETGTGVYKRIGVGKYNPPDQTSRQYIAESPSDWPLISGFENKKAWQRKTLYLF